ncbi:hypothetical protein BDF19DRAFT_447589 [Syncephalis fuscata]|nr:hypothetical protein BDF19DRAFT_447589 [Syncephalis fuscata]
MPTPTFPDEDMLAIEQEAIHTRLPESDSEQEDDYENEDEDNDGFSLSNNLLNMSISSDPYVPLSDSEDELINAYSSKRSDQHDEDINTDNEDDDDEDDIIESDVYTMTRTIISPPSPALSFDDDDDDVNKKIIHIRASNMDLLKVDQFEDDATFSDVPSDVDEPITGRISPASSFMEKLSLLANAHPPTNTVVIDDGISDTDTEKAEVEVDQMEARLKALLHRSHSPVDDPVTVIEEVALSTDQLEVDGEEEVTEITTSVSMVENLKITTSLDELLILQHQVSPHDIPLPPSPSETSDDDDNIVDSNGNSHKMKAIDAIKSSLLTLSSVDLDSTTPPPVGKVELPL